MIDQINQHLATIEAHRASRDRHFALLRLAALSKLVAAIRSAGAEEQEALAAHASARIRPIAHELPDLWEPAADMLTSDIESDEEPAIDVLTVLANYAPSILQMERILEQLGREWRAKHARLN